MFETTLRIVFKSDWHIGSGLGDGAIADAALNRDVDGLPFIPGSAIKGALRESAWRLALCDPERLGPLVEPLFGTPSEADKLNKPGRIFAGLGTLAPDLRAWLLALPSEERGDWIRDLTLVRQQTRLQDRQVVPGSLRAIECGIPGLEFTAALSCDLPEDCHAWFAGYLKALCAGIKSIGGDRARGLGRCVVSAASSKEGSACVPAEAPASLFAARGGERQ